MENRKGSGIFLGVIGVATLIVAIIGATFAFFGANISSEEGAVTVQSTTLALGYSDVITGLKTNLIPAEDEIAVYAATNESWVADKGECIDEQGNEVCGVYTFTIGNPSTTTTQDLYGSIKIVSNDFTDLYFIIFDERGNRVVDKTAFSTAVDGVISLSALNQALIPSSQDAGKTEADGFKESDPTTYTVINDKSLEENANKNSNVRTYKMLIWIDENFKDQTEENSGKTFAASINFTTASDTSGVTGVIAAANANGTQD